MYSLAAVAIRRLRNRDITWGYSEKKVWVQDYEDISSSREIVRPLSDFWTALSRTLMVVEK
jgi:hypothetical protein